MKKIVRLTESELKNIVETSVRRAIQEGAVNESGWKDWAIGAGLTAGALGTLGTENPVSDAIYDRIDQQFADSDEAGRAFPEDREFLNSGGELPDDTIGWEEANGVVEPSDIEDGRIYGENRIRRAVMESIKKLMNGKL